MCQYSYLILLILFPYKSLVSELSNVTDFVKRWIRHSDLRLFNSKTIIPYWKNDDWITESLELTQFSRDTLNLYG